MSDSDEDSGLFVRMEESGLWRVMVARTLQDATMLLQAQSFVIVVIDRDLPGQEWRETMTNFSTRSPRSCFLLTSRVNDEFLWKEVVKYGGYDVLAKPLDSLAVRLTLMRALHYATMPLRTA